LGGLGDEIFREDALRVRDGAYRIAPLLPEATSRCQHVMQRRIYVLLAELVDATKIGSPRIEQIENDVLDLVPRYVSFIRDQAAVYNLGKPSKEIVQNFLRHMQDEDAPHLSQDLDAWVNMHPTRPFEDVVNHILQTGAGIKLFVSLCCGKDDES
jgi:septum formation topological specificity factor MinE